MKKERQIKITLTTERTISIRSSRWAVALCEGCGKDARMMTPGQAALLTGISSREVYQRVETGEVHFAETSEGLLMICLDSFLKYESAQGELATEAESLSDESTRNPEDIELRSDAEERDRRQPAAQDEAAIKTAARKCSAKIKCAVNNILSLIRGANDPLNRLPPTTKTMSKIRKARLTSGRRFFTSPY